MHKALKLLILSLLPITSWGQTAMSKSANGVVVMNSIISINVTNLSNEPVYFSDINDYRQSKVVNSCYNISVISNEPWMVTVRASSPTFSKSSRAGSDDMPSTLLALKSSSAANFIPLSASPQRLLQSDNSNISNSYNIDARMNPPLNYNGGQYGINIIFTATPQ